VSTAAAALGAGALNEQHVARGVGPHRSGLVAKLSSSLISVEAEMYFSGTTDTP